MPEPDYEMMKAMAEVDMIHVAESHLAVCESLGAIAEAEPDREVMWCGWRLGFAMIKDY